jgi:hypothetical protein
MEPDYREGDGGRVQKNKKWKNSTFETTSSYQAMNMQSIKLF